MHEALATEEKLVLDDWYTLYNHLVHYGHEHSNGCCDVPEDYVIPGIFDDNEKQLGKWLLNQHLLYRNGNLLKKRKELLEVLVDDNKLHWILKDSHYDRKWNNYFNVLKQYCDDNCYGDCNVPLHFVMTLHDGTEVNLGVWLSVQRAMYKTKTLLQYRKVRLQELVDQNKLVWNANNIRSMESDNDEAWNQKYQQLLDCGNVSPIPDITLADDHLKVNRKRKLQSLVTQGKLKIGKGDLPSL